MVPCDGGGVGRQQQPNGPIGDRGRAGRTSDIPPTCHVDLGAGIDGDQNLVRLEASLGAECLDRLDRGVGREVLDDSGEIQRLPGVDGERMLALDLSVGLVEDHHLGFPGALDEHALISCQLTCQLPHALERGDELGEG